MLPDNHAKAYLSESYVNAVATQAGFTCEFAQKDYGVDARVSDMRILPSGKVQATGYEFRVQMKATHRCLQRADAVGYDLDADAHDRLALYEGGLIVLVVFLVPRRSGERIALGESCLELRNCCYWCVASGLPTRKNKRQTRVYIPRTQVFNPEACKMLMRLVRNGGWRK